MRQQQLLDSQAVLRSSILGKYLLQFIYRLRNYIKLMK